MHASPRSRLVQFVTILAALLLALADASAQVSISVGSARLGGSSSLGEHISKTDVAELNRILELDESQRLLLDNLHDAFMVELNTARSEMARIQDAVQKEFERTNDFSVFEGVSEKYASFNRYTKRLRDRLLDDLKLTLSEEQLERFSEFDRYYRRSRRLDSQTEPVRGSAVDLIAMTRRVAIPADQRAALASILERYAVDLDRYLLDNDPDQVASRTISRDDEIDAESMNTPEGMAKMMERTRNYLKEMRKISEGIREINERTLRQMASVLPEDSADLLNTQFKKDSFPEVYAETEGFSILRTVETFHDLTPEQNASLAELKKKFLSETDRLNNAWIEAIKANESKAAENDTGAFIAILSSDSDPLRRVRNERMALDPKLIEQIRNLLTPTQAQRLPGSEVVDWRSMGNWD